MLVHRKESETKAALKPAGNIVCAIFGRSKAKDRNDVNDITVRLQDFGTRLGYKIYRLIINAFLVKNRLEQNHCSNLFFIILVFHLQLMGWQSSYEQSYRVHKSHHDQVAHQ